MPEIIQEQQTKDFIKLLPELTVSPPSVHLLMLAARSRLAKVMHGVKIKDIVVERDIVRPVANGRDRYFDKVYNIAVLQNNGRYKWNDILVSPKVMGIFATLSPRNVYSSIVDLQKDTLTFLYQRDLSANLEVAKTHVLFFSALHKHKNRDYNFFTLDIDDPTLYPAIKDEVSRFNRLTTLQTSRGFHIILNLSNPNHAKEWYQGNFLSQLKLKYPNGLDLQNDAQEPIAGTIYYKPTGELHYVTMVD